MPTRTCRAIRLAVLACLSGALVLALALPAAAQQAPDTGPASQPQATSGGGDHWGLGWLLNLLRRALSGTQGGAAPDAAAPVSQAPAPPPEPDCTKEEHEAARKRKRDADIRHLAAEMQFAAEGRAGGPPSPATTTELFAAGAEQQVANEQEAAARDRRIERIKQLLAEKRAQRGDGGGAQGGLDQEIDDLTKELAELGGTEDDQVEEADPAGGTKDEGAEGEGRGAEDGAVNALLPDGDSSAMVLDPGAGWSGIRITDPGIVLPDSTRGGVFDNPFETEGGGVLANQGGLELPEIMVNTGDGFGSVFGGGTATVDACGYAC